MQLYALIWIRRDFLTEIWFLIGNLCIKIIHASFLFVDLDLE